jgi:hypothetical protein
MEKHGISWLPCVSPPDKVPKPVSPSALRVLNSLRTVFSILAQNDRRGPEVCPHAGHPFWRMLRVWQHPGCVHPQLLYVEQACCCLASKILKRILQSLEQEADVQTDATYHKWYTPRLFLVRSASISSEKKLLVLLLSLRLPASYVWKSLCSFSVPRHIRRQLSKPPDAKAAGVSVFRGIFATDRQTGRLSSCNSGPLRHIERGEKLLRKRQRADKDLRRCLISTVFVDRIILF